MILTNGQTSTAVTYHNFGSNPQKVNAKVTANIEKAMVSQIYTYIYIYIYIYREREREGIRIDS